MVKDVLTVVAMFIAALATMVFIVGSGLVIGGFAVWKLYSWLFGA